MSRNEDRIVRFSGVKPGIYDYTMVLGDDFFGEYENEEIEGGKVVFEVRMRRSERVTMLEFAFEGTLRTRCDRCLGAMELEVGGEDRLNIRFSDEEQGGDENTVVLPEDAHELDLSPWLYEFVAVRIPMRHTHAEGECDPATVSLLAEGSQGSGETDPRWDALKELK